MVEEGDRRQVQDGAIWMETVGDFALINTSLSPWPRIGLPLTHKILGHFQGDNKLINFFFLPLMYL
jgi:hypothetical protein